MSDTNPLSGFRSGNALMPPRPQIPPVPPRAQVPAVPVAPQAPQRILHQFQMHHARAALANDDQDTMIRKRDTIGREMTKLAEIAKDPDPNRADIAAYIGKLTRTGDVSADEAAILMQGLPNDGAGIRQWAGELFQNLLNVAVHAHAAWPRELFPGATGAGASPVGGQASEQAEQPAEAPNE